jgi:hypothetical protein
VQLHTQKKNKITQENKKEKPTKLSLPWNLVADREAEGLALLLEFVVDNVVRHIMADLPRLVPALLPRLIPALLARLVPTLLLGLLPALLAGFVPTLLPRLVPAFAVLVALLLRDDAALLLGHCRALLLNGGGALLLGDGGAFLLSNGLALLVQDGAALLLNLHLRHRDLNLLALLLHLVHALLVEHSVALGFRLVPTLLLRLVPALGLRHGGGVRLEDAERMVLQTAGGMPARAPRPSTTRLKIIT